jgi:hypothetical protein
VITKSINLLVLVVASVVECPRTGPVVDVLGFRKHTYGAGDGIGFLVFWRGVIWSSWRFVRDDFRMGVN